MSIRPCVIAFAITFGLQAFATLYARGADATSSTDSATSAKPVEQWGIFEVELQGPADGNPFVDVQLSAGFIPPGPFAGEPKPISGFYDGNGSYRIRFMPNIQGSWTYTTASNRKELDGKTGSFTVIAPAKSNHGPVQVRNSYHFGYADGTPFFPFGTTCYAWTHQSDALEKETLDTLAASPFNKIRMCVFPKWYAHNQREPKLYPFAGDPPNHWDFTRFNPAFFHHLEERVGQLRDLGIEADLILFHPYDVGHWGFDQMSAEADDRYLRYVIARLAAYRNVWWSLANEYDFMKAKKESDWDRFIPIVAHDDPYAHLRSIHNGTKIYNHTNPLITHASIQNGSEVEDVGRAQILRDVYRKPIMYDEVKYEGNITQRWGNLSAEELVHRFWNAIIAGTYATHGETYENPDQIWWSHGGKLHGKSPERIAFLRKIVEQGPADGIEQVDKWQDMRTAGKRGEYYLIYLGKETPSEWALEFPATKLTGPLDFRVDVIDAWNMTITPQEGVFHFTLKPDKYRYACQNSPTIKLPGKPYTALRLTRVREGQ